MHIVKLQQFAQSNNKKQIFFGHQSIQINQVSNHLTIHQTPNHFNPSNNHPINPSFILSMQAQQQHPHPSHHPQQSYSSYSINETHNLVVQNIVQNQQVKFIMFHKIEHIRLLYKNGQEHRFLTGLVVAGRDFVKLYALYTNQVFQQLSSHKIHQDITALHSWQRCIVLQTREKIIGLVYEQSMLKNAFMLSLQFLPLNPKDSCKCSFDKQGLMFTVLIKNFLLIVFSDAMLAKFKAKPQYKEFTEIVGEDIKWNRPEKTYVEEVIKIKISDFQLSKVENVNICNDAIYFIGLKNFQKPNQQQQFHQLAFYHIQAPLFFVESKTPVISLLAKKDPQVKQMTPYVYNKQMQCLFCKKDSIYVQIGREMVLVDMFEEGEYEVVHRGSGEGFSLWVKVDRGREIRCYYRSGNVFVRKVVAVGFWFQGFLLKEDLASGEGTIVYSNQTEVGVLGIDLGFVKGMVENNTNSSNTNTNNNNQNQQIEQQITLSQKNTTHIHKSFGNIVDFQFGKNSIFMVQSRLGIDQSQQHSQPQINSKLYQLRRSLVTDPKPYITHEKKNHLQQLLTRTRLRAITTIKFRFPNSIGSSSYNVSSSPSDNIIVTESLIDLHNRFVFYREVIGETTNNNNNNKEKHPGLEKVVDGVAHYGKVVVKEREYLVLISGEGECKVLGEDGDGAKGGKVGLEGFVGNDRGHGRSLGSSVFFIENYVIYQVSNQSTSTSTSTSTNNIRFKLYDIFKQTTTQISLPLNTNNNNPLNTLQHPLKTFMTKKHLSFRKRDKTNTVIEITLIFSTSLQIFQLYPQSKDLRLVYKCQNIPKGLAYLSNHCHPSLLHNTEPTSTLFHTDRLRSITCPEYILTQHHTSTRHLTIKTSIVYVYRDISYLILVNSQGELIVYRKCLNFQDECGFVYKRVVLPLNIVRVFRWQEDEGGVGEVGEGMVKVGNVVVCKGQFLEHNVNHVSYFQMDGALWTVEKEKIKMIDLKPLAGSNQPLFRQFYRKDYKDFGQGNNDLSKQSNNTLQQNIEIMSNFILTPIRTMMRKQLMGLQISGDYFTIYSKSGFQVLTQKDMKPVWACNLSAQNPQRKQVIITAKTYDHFIAVSYYDYIHNEHTEFKSIKFKFRIYNILSKKKILQKPKSIDEPILHIRPISAEKILIATSSTLYIYLIRGEKSLEPIRTRNFSKRFGLSTFSYIPEVYDEKNQQHKPCYMLLANQFGGLSFFVGKWIENDFLREIWFEKIRCHVRNVQLFHYGQQLKALITDEDNNLIVINLKPQTQQQPAKAQKLADLNVGSRANVLRIKNEQDRKIYACFQDGTIKSITAVKLDNPEVSLIDFQEESFCKEIPFMGGFNQRVSRLLGQKYRTYKYVSRGNMVDCEVLEEFFSMTTNLKEYILEKSELRMDQLKAIVRSI